VIALCWWKKKTGGGGPCRETPLKEFFRFFRGVYFLKKSTTQGLVKFGVRYLLFLKIFTSGGETPPPKRQVWKN